MESPFVPMVRISLSCDVHADDVTRIMNDLKKVIDNYSFKNASMSCSEINFALNPKEK